MRQLVTTDSVPSLKSYCAGTQHQRSFSVAQIAILRVHCRRHASTAAAAAAADAWLHFVVVVGDIRDVNLSLVQC